MKGGEEMIDMGRLIRKGKDEEGCQDYWGGSYERGKNEGSGNKE